jgi:4a-hydroxytetrahydrobiopterin dehydratase
VERKKMTAEEAAEKISSTRDWRVEADTLTKRFEFKNFAESLAFVNQVGAIAEAADHHPDIKFGWGYAEISTTTHDRGGVTDVDFALVDQIDRIDQINAT